MAAPLIGIIANTDKDGADSVVSQLRAKFAAAGAECRLEEKTARLVVASDGLPIGELVDEVELVVLLGGDGTILHFAATVGKDVKPIAAINIGNLGFLTSPRPSVTSFIAYEQSPRWPSSLMRTSITER